MRCPPLAWTWEMSVFAREALATARELFRCAEVGSGPWLPETGRALRPHGSQHVT